MSILSSTLTLMTVKSSDAVGTYQGTCSTLGTEQVKVVEGITKEVTDGLQILITFDHKNTISSPNLKVSGTIYPIYAGKSPLTKNSQYNWSDGKSVNFIYFDKKWYMTAASSADTMEFDDNGKLRIFNSEYGSTGSENTGLKMELGESQLDFKLGSSSLATYGPQGVELYDASANRELRGKSYAKFGSITRLGYDENHPHLTAGNTYLAMNDAGGEYFRVCRKGLMYKAKKNDDNKTEQWLGISAAGGIGIITDDEYNKIINEENDDDMTIIPTIKDGQDAISVQITSSNGNIFLSGSYSTTKLFCKVFSGTVEVTDKIKTLTWTKTDKNGAIEWTKIVDWNKTNEKGINYIIITNEDVSQRASFGCAVELDI